MARAEWDTGKLAAARAMEIDWGWNGEKRPEGKYLKTESPEAQAIAEYVKKFGMFPPSGISRTQRRRIRQFYNIPSHIW